MKKVKYVFWLVIAGLVALVVYQNQEIFMAKHSLGINLYFFKEETPELVAGVYYLSMFLIGLLISYFFSLSQKFKSRKTIRQLNEKIAANQKKIAELESKQPAEPREHEAAPQQAPAGENTGGQEKTGE